MSVLARMRLMSRNPRSARVDFRRARRQRPEVERLEDRTVPDTGVSSVPVPPDTGSGTTGVTGPFTDPGSNNPSDSTVTTAEYMQFVKRLYLDLLQRPPTAADSQYSSAPGSTGLPKTAW